MLEKEAREYASGVALPFMSPDLSKTILDLIAKAYREGAERHSNVWHDLRKDPSDLPKKSGRYIVCYKPLSTHKDEFILIYNKDNSSWTDDCGERYGKYIIGWCEKPIFDEQEDMND